MALELPRTEPVRDVMCNRVEDPAHLPALGFGRAPGKCLHEKGWAGDDSPPTTITAILYTLSHHNS